MVLHFPFNRPSLDAARAGASWCDIKQNLSTLHLKCIIDLLSLDQITNVVISGFFQTPSELEISSNKDQTQSFCRMLANLENAKGLAMGFLCVLSRGEV